MTADECPWAWHRRRGPWVCSQCDKLLLGPDTMCVVCGDEAQPVPLGHTGPVPVRDRCDDATDDRRVP